MALENLNVTSIVFNVFVGLITIIYLSCSNIISKPNIVTINESMNQ